MIGLSWAGERGVLEADRTFDLDRFERLYERSWPDVFRYAWLIARNHHDAEDIAAEAFRRALESWAAGRGPQGEPMPWLLVITRRIAIDRARRRRLIAWLPMDEARDREDERGAQAIRSSEVWMWFERLCEVVPASQREALFLRFVFDLADADGAAVMRTSVGNYRTLVSRGLAALRRQPEAAER